MDDLAELRGFLMWGMGICVTGFLFLAGWMWWIVGKLHEKVSHSWLEETFQNKLETRMTEIDSKLAQIRDALVGTLEQEGVITDVKRIKKRCEYYHPEARHE